MRRRGAAWRRSGSLAARGGRSGWRIPAVGRSAMVPALAETSSDVLRSRRLIRDQMTGLRKSRTRNDYGLVGQTPLACVPEHVFVSRTRCDTGIPNMRHRGNVPASPRSGRAARGPHPATVLQLPKAYAANEAIKVCITEPKHEFVWTWAGKTIQIGFERRGAGPIVLMLPALSSISTLSEMRPLQQRLASLFTTVSVDWPGFGDRPKPRVDWRPEAYSAFLNHLVTRVGPSPFATVAAGHAAGYVLVQAATVPGSMGRLCLVAPTWRGPLPTMMGKRSAASMWIVRAVDHPLLGPPYYRLNVNRFIVRMMGRGHVCADPNWLSGARLAEKLAVTRAAGARHASVRFVAGVGSTQCEAGPTCWR